MNWTTPFELAFNILMWSVGIILVVALVLFLLLVLYALFKAFSSAFKNVKGNIEKATGTEDKPTLTPVD